MPFHEWEKVLRDAERLAPGWPWERAPMPDDYDAIGFTVKKALGEWTVVVVRFSIEDQGFPKGSVGYDGACRKGSTIVRCTREVAEHLWLIAHEKVEG